MRSSLTHCVSHIHLWRSSRTAFLENTGLPAILPIYFTKKYKNYRTTKKYSRFNLVFFWFFSNDRFDGPASSLPSKPVACNELSRVHLEPQAVRRVLKQYTVPKTPKVPKPVPWNQVTREYLVPATKTVPCSRYQHLIEKLENRTELSGSSWKSFSAVTTLLGELPS